MPFHSNTFILHHLFQLVLFFYLAKLFAVDQVVFVFINVDKLRVIMNLVGLNKACKILDYLDQYFGVSYIPIFYHIFISSLFLASMAKTKKVVKLT